MGHLTEKLKKIKRQTMRSRYAPEYGLEILHLLLVKDRFTHVSFASNSIPGPGSETKPIEQCNQPMAHEVTKVVIHKDFRVTLCTNRGNAQYLKL